MKADLSQAAKSRLVFIGGDDGLARSEALQQILKLAGSDPLETETIIGDKADPSTWFAHASTSPFFSERRVTIVRNIGRNQPSDTWDAPVNKSHPALGPLSGLPETSLLILVADEETGGEERQRKVEVSAKVWGKICELAGGVQLVYVIDPSQTVGLIRHRAKELGKTVTPRAAALLSEMVLSKPSLAIAELEKIALFLGDAPEIRESDVQSVAVAENEYNVFKLVDSIVMGDSARAVMQVRTLFAQTSNVAEQVIPRVFPALLSQIRSIWQARMCQDMGVDPSNPPEEVGQWLPAKSIASEPDWKLRKSVQHARRLGLDRLTACIHVLVEADGEVKGQRPSVTIQESVERMTLEMCQICSTSKS